MTYHEFLDRLAKAKGFIWSLENGQIRAQRGKRDEQYCPITAVAEVVTGGFYSLGDFDGAASDIGLDPNVAGHIVDATDDSIKHVGARRRKIIRAQLLQVTGLAS